MFVSALRDALLAGEVDVAVHSLKDLPTAPADGIALAAVPAREDPRDVVVARDGLTLGELPPGAGSAPARRAASRSSRPSASASTCPASAATSTPGSARSPAASSTPCVLARAGLARLGRLDEVTEVLDPLQMLPAPGQGALAVECRTDDTDLVAALAALDDPATRAAVDRRARRAGHARGRLLRPARCPRRGRGGRGRRRAVGARGRALHDGGLSVRMCTTGPVADAAGVGRRLASDMLADGAADLMEAPVRKQQA